jgi:hypothetical protein
MTAPGDTAPPALEGGEAVTVTFTLVDTFAGGASRPTMRMQQHLSVGQSFVGDVMEGRPFSFGVASGPDGCGGQVSITPAESQMPEHRLAWSADARVLEASTERIVLGARWKRFERASDGRGFETASESIDRLVLGEGERVLLDFARPAGARCLRSAALELSVSVKEDPALAGRQIAYDVWLVHEGPGGTKRSARTQLTGRQGEQLPFAFPRQRLPAGAGGGPGTDELEVEVTGRVRGRLRSDGGVVLSLDTWRGLSYVAPDGSNDGGIGDGGQKVVEVRPGEVIRIELPDPARGRAGEDARASRMSQDLHGHAFAMIVTAKVL